MGNNCNCNSNTTISPEPSVHLYNEEIISTQSESHTNTILKGTRTDKKAQNPAMVKNIGFAKFKEGSSGVIINKKLTPKDIEVITNAFKKHFIFKSLADEDQSQIIKQMVYMQINAGDLVFEQGAPAKSFYILNIGSLEVRVDGKIVNRIKPGEGFGELALMHDVPRSATILAQKDSQIWALERKTFRKMIEEMNALNYQENVQFIETVPVLQGLTNQQKDNLSNSLIPQIFSKGQQIVIEGEDGDRLFIIKEGVVSCIKNGQEIRRLYKGDFFGEQALLYNCKRTATVQAESEVKCVYMVRETLDKLLGSQLQLVLYRNTQRDALQHNILLNKLTKEQIERLIDLMTTKEMKKNEIVVQKGSSMKDTLIIVLKGSLKKQKLNLKVAEKGQSLGLKQIMDESEAIYDDNIIVETDTADIAFCTNQQFEECIGGRLDRIMQQNEVYEVLKQVHALRHLSENKMQQLLRALKTCKYEDGQEIVQQNQKGDKFFVIKKGKVLVLKDNVKIRTITKYDYFGERSLLFDEFRSATVKAEGHVTCWALGKTEFMNILEEPIRKYLMRRIEMQDENIQVEKLICLKLLGKGMFGNVFLTKHPDKQIYYALKCIRRFVIESFAIQENVMLERQILLQIDHPLIMKLIKTQKDAQRIYFITEYVPGKDLFDVLRDIGLVSNASCQFYTASLLLILEYLHERDIIYRDLKPENIMVDYQGYLKLIDFGTAKIVRSRTYTIVGTPHYMAPEVIIGKGYGYQVDYWSLGIIVYEFICGGVPFGEEEEDPYAIYEKILEYRLRFPSFVGKNFPSKTFIEQLLSRTPSMRNGGSIQKLKSHS